MSDIENTSYIDVKIGDSSVRLLGTAHVSRSSVEAVTAAVSSGEFDSVAIELCQNRYRSMIDPDNFEKTNLIEVLWQGRAKMIVAMLAMGAFQQRIAEQLGVEPGGEMRAAIVESQAVDIPLELIDRDIGITVQRIYGSVPWWKRPHLFLGLLGGVLSTNKVEESEIEALKKTDMLQAAMEEFHESAGSVFEPLITERDLYMACKIKALMSREACTILAVVGAGHVPGIARLLDSDEDLSDHALASLEERPKTSRLSRYIPWVIVAIICGGFATGFSRSTELGVSLVVDWIVINGGLSSLGVLVAGGHPITIASAFLAAPLTSLNPTIGAGMVVGIVEAWIRKPTISDFRLVRKDVASLKGWRKNKVARTMLVFVLGTLGSAVGTYVAGFRIFGQLVG